jgi:tellurite resistance protein
MLMLAYAVALADEKLDVREHKRLAQFASAFGMSHERDELMRSWASEKIIENMLLGCYADGTLDAAERERISKLAGNIGVNVALVAKIDVRIRKRLGSA